MLESHDCAAGRAGVPDADSLIVGAGDEQVAVAARHKRTASNIVRMAGKRETGVVGGKIPEADRLVVAGAHQRRELGRRPFGHPDGLLVYVPRLENDGVRATADIEDLHLSRVLAGHQHAAISTDFAAVRLAVEAADRLERLALADRKDIDARA